MNGEPDQAGILPRSLDIIFNSIADVQAPKFVLQPDGTNRFDLFTEEEANTEAQRNKPKKISPRMRYMVYHVLIVVVETSNALVVTQLNIIACINTQHTM